MSIELVIIIGQPIYIEFLILMSLIIHILKCIDSNLLDVDEIVIFHNLLIIKYLSQRLSSFTQGVKTY